MCINTLHKGDSDDDDDDNNNNNKGNVIVIAHNLKFLILLNTFWPLKLNSALI
jgi:hypothetical protein